MQLGTRWPFGGEPPASVPAAEKAAIARYEAMRRADATRSTGLTWTLTWLEGRAHLALDDGTELVVERGDANEKQTSGDDDDW